MGGVKIVADENMARVRELFGDLGELTCLPGRSISSEDVVDADVLLVRSVTRVDSALLAGSRIRFVGTATIGTDHLDLPWLSGAGIVTASAPGCNARSVVDYVLAALFDFWRRDRLDWDRRVFGVVGLGNVGARLARTLQGLGLKVVGCDPFVSHPDIRQLPLDELLAEADVLSLHTPLTHGGRYPTWHLFDDRRLRSLRKNTILINTGRGDVVDNKALLRLLREGLQDGSDVALDVWENEPGIDPELLRAVAIGTPHIAGYSQEGKWQGSLMVREALCRFLGKPSGLPLRSEPLAEDRPLLMSETGWLALAGLVESAYPLLRDDAALREVMSASGAPDRKSGFDGLRKNYGRRREFSAWRVQTASPPDALTLSRLQALGFKLSH